MKILQDYPFHDHPTSLMVSGEPVQIRAYQIAVIVSLSDTTSTSTPFPAVLDTGHSHNFSISEEQHIKWAGFPLENCHKLGRIIVNAIEVLLIHLRLVVHSNIPGTSKLSGVAADIAMPEGISVFPRGKAGPRLPLLGLRALARNNFQLRIQNYRVDLDQG